MAMKQAFIVIAHGSRDAEAQTAFEIFLRKLQRSLNKKKVYGAFLEIAKPSIPQAIETAIQAKASEIFILPLMFFPGKHVKQHIPQFIQEAKANHPEVDFHYASPVAEHPFMMKLLKDKVQQLRKRGK